MPQAAFDAAPFAQPLADGLGLVWEDLREVHRLVVHSDAPLPADTRLEYWRTRWPQERLPTDHIPGGGGVGWQELGNWYTGQWQPADTDVHPLPLGEGRGEGGTSSTATFTFRPVNATEFPDLTDFAATFRTTLKLRLVSEGPLPAVCCMEAFTASTCEEVTLAVCFPEAPECAPAFEVFNGELVEAVALAPDRYALRLIAARNPDPNCFDKTLLTVRGATATGTVALDDLPAGPIWVPSHGLCVTSAADARDYVEIAAAIQAASPKGIYDAIEDMPEQTWQRAWAKMTPKRERIILPLSVDGGRHKFRANPDGSLQWRTNNHLLAACPGADSERLAADKPDLNLSLNFGEPVVWTIQEAALPIGLAAWEQAGVRIEQTAFGTILDGTDPAGEPPPADAFGIAMFSLRLTNQSPAATVATLSLNLSAAGAPEALAVDGDLILADNKLRVLLDLRGKGTLSAADGAIVVTVPLEVGETHDLVIKVPYVALEGEEITALRALDFAAEHEAVAAYWRRRLDEGMKLTVPEATLTEFHRAHTGHLLINCEKEPDRVSGSGLQAATRRFARVGSFGYAAFGNESIMMTVDMDRRGYHREARECYEAFCHYQGTAPLPGDFSTQEGILYGTCGYEHGGYNQHHGWILWGLVEHYKFTRDEAWLEEVAGNMLAAAQWIVGERGRTQNGLLPFGSLEDIGDWWQWLSTNCYTWRGLDAAAWALEEIAHPDAARLRADADDYRAAILQNFRAAAERSPVVKLRDGRWVPHIPSHLHRRGRAFGWICETLEGAIHLLIAGVLPPDCEEADHILRDYEDNLHLSPLYGYTAPDYDRQWFDLGGFSMQACLLFDVEPYLYRDDIKHALRAAFNGIAANYFPEMRMLAEHALPDLGDYRGDHYKSSDEANATGWLRHMFVREQDDTLLVGQAVPREWLKPGARVGVENAVTYFGPMSVTYEATETTITARISGPDRNPPDTIAVRFRAPAGKEIVDVQVNGQQWDDVEGDWVILTGDGGEVEVRVGLG